MPTKLIMLAHGSSNMSWSDAFFEMTEAIRRSNQQAELAFMELSSPSLHEKCREAAQQGITTVKVLPLFLARGRHLKKDVPDMISELQSELGIAIELLPPIGENDLLRHAIQNIVDTELSKV